MPEAANLTCDIGCKLRQQPAELMHSLEGRPRVLTLCIIEAKQAVGFKMRRMHLQGTSQATVLYINLNCQSVTEFYL